MRRLAVLALLIVLAGCAMTPEQRQRLGEALQDFSQDVRELRDRQRRARPIIIIEPAPRRSLACTSYRSGDIVQTYCY